MQKGLIGLLALLSGACASVPAPPVDQFYRLPAVTDAEPVRLTDAAILVTLLRAEGIQREQAILYSSSPQAVELIPYRYHFWYAAPAQLLRDQFIDYLRAASAAGQVTSDRHVKTDMRIDGRIRELLHVRSNAVGDTVDHVRVVLELKLSRPVDRETLLLDVFSSEVPVLGNDMEDVVTAFGQATEENYSAFLAAASRVVNR